MSILLLFVATCFWILLLYYSVLLIAGIAFRTGYITDERLPTYPSVSILIPAHNEGKVLGDTLQAMVNLDYPGHLEILVLNDSSTDKTGEIAKAFARHFPNVRHVSVPPGTPKGKSRVLNYGLSLVDSSYVAVFDADNQPEPDALRLLVEAAERAERAGGAVGYVKTINEERNILTRMIALEFSIFQLVMQCGRWVLFRTGSLTGTNMIVKRSVLQEVGAWDPYALAEDAELTLRITSAGYSLPVVPHSRTWEQEPESLRVWLRQRTRWMQGNVYLILKSFSSPSWWRGRVLVHTLQQLAIYIVFIIFVMLSDTWFILGLLNLVSTQFAVPLLLIWFEACVIYVAQLYAAIVLDDLGSPQNITIANVMYFTYAQLWIVILVRGWFRQLRSQRRGTEIVWDKTIRF